MLQPKYATLKTEIIKQINDEQLKDNQMIPSERQLCQTYSLSRITVRKAVEELVAEGYLYKIHGKGTFVKSDVGTKDLFSIVSCTEDIVNSKMKPHREVIFSGVADVISKTATKLEISNNEKIFQLSRIYYADGVPVNHTITYLPYKYFQGIEKYDFANCSLYEVIEKKYNIKITKAVRTLEAILAIGKTASFLQVENQTPIILFRAVTYGLINGKEVPIETFKSSYRTDKIKFYINQIRS